MEARILRQKYLEFFKAKGHAIIPSAPLLPENDPQPLCFLRPPECTHWSPILMGEPHPGGTRLTNFENALRTGDIDEVGDNTHLTFSRCSVIGDWAITLKKMRSNGALNF